MVKSCTELRCAASNDPAVLLALDALPATTKGYKSEWSTKAGRRETGCLGFFIPCHELDITLTTFGSIEKGTGRRETPPVTNLEKAKINSSILCLCCHCSVSFVSLHSSIHSFICPFYHDGHCHVPKSAFSAKESGGGFRGSTSGLHGRE